MIGRPCNYWKNVQSHYHIQSVLISVKCALCCHKRQMAGLPIKFSLGMIEYRWNYVQNTDSVSFLRAFIVTYLDMFDWIFVMYFLHLLIIIIIRVLNLARPSTLTYCLKQHQRKSVAKENWAFSICHRRQLIFNFTSIQVK